MKKRILLLLLVCFFTCYAFSQAINDAGLWASLNLEKKVSKRLEFVLTQSIRIKENYSSVNLFYTDIGMGIKPFGFMKVVFSYRAIQKARLDETYSFRHRLTMDVVLKRKFGRVVTSFRQRLQTQVSNVYSSETGKLPEWLAREKLEIKYDLDKPIEPYVSVELRYQLKDPKNMPFNGTWNRVRYTFGLDYKLNDKNAFSLYYIIQRGFNIPEPQNLYITGIAYTLSL